jgi:hypothetical protein
VGVRVQFVQGRAPLQLTLPFPLPTVGELKQRVQEAYGGAFACVRLPACCAAGVLTTHLCSCCAEIPPERQRLVFAGQILAPDDKDLALVKARALAKHLCCADALTLPTHACRTSETARASFARSLPRPLRSEQLR